MPSPILHAAAGASICLFNRRSEPYFVVPVMLASVMPDFDFVPGLIMGDPNRFHASYSHSLGFAVLAAAATALLVRRDRWRVAGWAAFAWCAHGLLDSLSRDSRPPIGVPLLWPLYDVPLNFQLLPSIRHGGDHATTWEFVSAVFSTTNLTAYATEIVMALPLLAFCYVAGRQFSNVRQA